MSQGDMQESRADIAREYMIADAQQVAGEDWECVRCGRANDSSAEFCAQCGADGHGANKILRAAQPASRFPSAPETRRSILEAISRANSKYARPFDQGKVASVSLIGTESWAEYGAIVLQMAMLDTLLSIEEKLTEVLQHPGEGPGVVSQPSDLL
jgi:membrane protease subunit (stomatin/prohibitin family)